MTCLRAAWQDPPDAAPIQQTEFGGPERAAARRTYPSPSPAPASPDPGHRAGNELRRHASAAQRYLAAQELPACARWRGGPVVREDTGERVVALCGTGATRVRDRFRRSLCFPIPDGVDDGRRSAMLIQG